MTFKRGMRGDLCMAYAYAHLMTLSLMQGHSGLAGGGGGVFN